MFDNEITNKVVFRFQVPEKQVKVQNVQPERFSKRHTDEDKVLNKHC